MEWCDGNCKKCNYTECCIFYEEKQLIAKELNVIKKN